jgi:hypothetical protein
MSKSSLLSKSCAIARSYLSPCKTTNDDGNREQRLCSHSFISVQICLNLHEPAKLS